jgi:glycosyltransferase involved in cell wall biosynthesis
MKHPLPTLDLSVVVPLLNEEESLPELVAWIHRVATQAGLSYEIVLIDDGSTDRSWEVIGALRQQYPALRGISFLRNYGKSAALHVGFQRVRGRVVITMDADLQDSPDEIPELCRMIEEEGYDLVSGWKRKRYDPISKTIPSKFFNYVTRKLSGIPLHDFNCGLKAYRYKVVKHIEVYGEMHRYIPVIAKWSGFRKIGERAVQHRARKYGSTKFGLERFLNGFLDLLSIMFVSRFRKSPMHFFGFLGTLSFLFGFGFAGWILLEKFVLSKLGAPIPRDVVDQPLFFLSLTAIVIGVQLFLAGFLGEMVARNEPHRNEYHIDDMLDETAEQS